MAKIICTEEEYDKLYWDNIAVLEVETNISDIILPKWHDGKVRTSKVKVIREVPLDECGILGKVLADRSTKKDGYKEAYKTFMLKDKEIPN